MAGIGRIVNACNTAAFFRRTARDAAEGRRLGRAAPSGWGHGSRIRGDFVETQTLRRKIIALLTDREMDARGLSEVLRIKEKEVYEHLIHVERSVQAAGGQFILTPSECLLCGYVFEDRRRLTRPGRCPRCRRSKLQNPSFRIACESDDA